MTKTTEHFKTALDKHPDRRVRTLDHMRAMLVSHCLMREFGESMEAFYARRPDVCETDERLKDLIIEYEGVKL